MSYDDAAIPDRATFPREKPRRLHIAVAYRTYYWLAALLPSRVLLKALLQLAWLFKQLAWEHAWRSLPSARIQVLTRPNAERFLCEHIPRGSSVFDFGGGRGFGTRVAASVAARVVYADQSEANAAAARALCAGLPNVTFIVADAQEALLNRDQETDVVLLMHVLGYFEDTMSFLTQLRARARRLLIEVPDFASDPLNRLRVVEDVSCYTDAEYRVEFTADHLRDCLRRSGWEPLVVEARDGSVLAVAVHAPSGAS